MFPLCLQSMHVFILIVYSCAEMRSEASGRNFGRLGCTGCPIRLVSANTAYIGRIWSTVGSYLVFFVFLILLFLTYSEAFRFRMRPGREASHVFIILFASKPPFPLDVFQKVEFPSSPLFPCLFLSMAACCECLVG